MSSHSFEKKRKKEKKKKKSDESKHQSFFKAKALESKRLLIFLLLRSLFTDSADMPTMNIHQQDISCFSPR